MIVGRIMASAVICRIIVAYELAGITAAEETMVKATTVDTTVNPALVITNTLSNHCGV
jgi:hypothetical protein